MLSKLEKRAVCDRVEKDLVEAFVRASEHGVRLELVEGCACSYLKVCDADMDKPFLDSVFNALNYFIASFGVLQLLIDYRKSDFVRDVCKRHGFELVEGGC